MKRRGPWVVYAMCAMVVLAAMAWITSDLLALERAQHEARADAAHQEAMRLALWRMDSWLAPEIALETASPTPGLSKVVRAVYAVSPSGDVRALRRGTADAERVARAVDVAAARRRIDFAEERMRSVVCDLPTNAGASDANGLDYASRSRANAVQQLASGNVLPLESAGPVTPMWVPLAGAPPALVFVQSRSAPQLGVGGVADGDLTVHVSDWNALQRVLRQEAAQVLPDVELRPRLDDTADIGAQFVLASVPATLESPRPALATLPLFTPTRTTLAVAWSALAAALVAVGVALRRTTDLSERRSRFASSVTHELRTPLTTFRLYSEMLADGMVEGPVQRQEYLDTLKTESSRLAHLVENVLSYARVEEGRMPLRRERIAVDDLLQRAMPPLERRTADAGMSLAIDVGSVSREVVDVDPDVVGQILFNLVDNACKYAASAVNRTIELTASRDDGTIVLRVRDHGSGIPAARVRAAFTPFERAGRPAGDAVPGIGLGLALSRALARDLGGDLAYEPSKPSGATFVLTLPAA